MIYPDFYYISYYLQIWGFMHANESQSTVIVIINTLLTYKFVFKKSQFFKGGERIGYMNQ